MSNEYPNVIQSTPIEQLPENEGRAATGLLDSSVLIQDKVFEGIIKAISPDVIVAENTKLIDSFVDLLADASPISVNIIDFFSKNPNIASISEVQDELAEMYLKNFHFVWNKAKNDYVLKNKLEKLLKQYRELTGSIDEGDFNFFGNEKELYTTERYILAKEFNQSKGKTTAIEYAYRVAWLANIEGPLRTEYDFNITQESCKGFDAGFYICKNVVPELSGGGECSYTNADYPPLAPVEVSPPPLDGNGIPIFPVPIEPGSLDPGRVPQDATQGFSKFINTFMISDEVNENPCFPFRYVVEGSMIPDFFEAFVIPLAHPVGFRYIYQKLFKTAFIDYFNVELIYRADEVFVSTLCPGGDCNLSSIKTQYSDVPPNVSITNSQWKTFEELKVDIGPYAGSNSEKYIFENGSYLIQYTFKTFDTATERIINYFDIPKLRSLNLIKNGTFSDYRFWKLDATAIQNYETKWVIKDEKAFSINAEPLDIMAQDVILEAGRNYLIEIAIQGVSQNNPVTLRIGKWEIFNTVLDGNGVPQEVSFNPKRYEENTRQLTENITYTIDYTARGGEKIEFYTVVPPAGNYVPFEYSIDDVLVIKFEPTKVYEKDSHSIIGLINAAPPLPILFTKDEFGKDQGMHYFPTDDMNDLYYLNKTSGFFDSTVGPIEGTPEAIGLPATQLGNMVINEFHYGQAKYKTIGQEKIIEGGLHFGDTVDYAVTSSIDPNYGEINTRYININQGFTPDIDFKYTKNELLGLDSVTRFINIDEIYEYTLINSVGQVKLSRIYKSLRTDNTTDVDGNRVPTTLYNENFLDNLNWKDVETDFTYTKDGQFGPDGEISDFIAGESVTYTRIDAQSNIVDANKYISLLDRTGVILYDEDFTNTSNWEVKNTDLNEIDFTDPLNWEIFLADIDPDQEVESITNEGGFIVGGKIIPWGDPNTAYIKDIINIDRSESDVWQNAFYPDSQDFQNPIKWEQNGLGTDWDIIESGINYAECGYPYHINYNWINDLTSGSETSELKDVNNNVISPAIINIDTDTVIQVTIINTLGITIIDNFDYISGTNRSNVNLLLEDFSDTNLWLPYKNGRTIISHLVRDLDIKPPISNVKTPIVAQYAIEFDKTEAINNNTFLDFSLGLPANFHYTEYLGFTPAPEVFTMVVGETIDYIILDSQFELTSSRYKVLINTTFTANTEDFNNTNNWLLIETNNIYRYQKSQVGSWMGFYEADDKFVFGASPRFKGKVTSFSASWLVIAKTYSNTIIEGNIISNIVTINENDTVNTRNITNKSLISDYKSLTNLGSIDISIEDFTNILKWELIFTAEREFRFYNWREVDNIQPLPVYTDIFIFDQVKQTFNFETVITFEDVIKDVDGVQENVRITTQSTDFIYSTYKALIDLDNAELTVINYSDTNSWEEISIINETKVIVSEEIL